MRRLGYLILLALLLYSPLSSAGPGIALFPASGGGSPAESVFDNSGSPWPLFSQIPAINYDKGGQGLAYHVPFIGAPNCNPVSAPAQAYRPDYVNLSASTDNVGIPFQIGCNFPGNSYNYIINISMPGPYIINARLANGDTGGSWSVSIDHGPVLATINSPNTGSFSAFATQQSSNFNATPGNHILTITAASGGTTFASAGDLLWIQGSAVGFGVPQIAQDAGFNTLASDFTFSNTLYQVQSNWLDC